MQGDLRAPHPGGPPRDAFASSVGAGWLWCVPMQAAADDLSHITGSCARCKRSGLVADDFIEAHLRQFLRDQTSARGRSTFVDARDEIRGATRRTEVAGASLFCRPCVERERAEAAAADDTWNDDTEAETAAASTQVSAAAEADVGQREVADSWEDDG